LDDTGRPRTIIDIGKAAKLSAEEGPNGPRLVKYRGKTVGAHSYVGEAGCFGSSTFIAASSAI
jgi:hypothetical protein